MLYSWIFWRKFRLKGYNQQLLTYEASFGSILQIIQYRFTGVGNRLLNVVDFQRPDWICGSFSSTFQLTWLVKKPYVHIGWEFFFRLLRQLCDKKWSGATAFSLMASAGFFPIYVMTSPFRAETTAGSRTTHSEDLWPAGSRISTSYWCRNRHSARVRLNLSMIGWSQ